MSVPHDGSVVLDRRLADETARARTTARAGRRRRGRLLQQPEVSRAILSARPARGGALVRLRVRAQCHAPTSQAQKIASGFGFLDNTAGFGISQIADSLQRAGHLRPRLLRRPAQHAAGRRRRHRACDDARLPHRHRAAVAQLAAGAARRRLCGIDPQPAAPVPDPVLVPRRARHAAGTAPEPLAIRRRFSSTTAASSCRARCSARDRDRAAGLAGRRRWRLSALRIWARAAPGAHRPAVPGAVGGARAAARRCRSWPCAAPACRSRSRCRSCAASISSAACG